MSRISKKIGLSHVYKHFNLKFESPSGTKSERADLKWSAFFCAEKTIQCSTFAWRQPIDLLVTDHAAMLLASGHTRRLPSLRRIKAERIAWLMAFSHSAAPLNPLPLV